MDPTNVARTTASYPKYQCLKEVFAAKIAGVEHGADGSLKLHLAGGFDNVIFSHEEMKRLQKPEIGWWLVVYADGYRSFSPAKAFEEGYTPVGEKSRITEMTLGAGPISLSGIPLKDLVTEMKARYDRNPREVESISVGIFGAGRIAEMPGRGAGGQSPGGNQLQSGTGTTAQNSEFGRRRDDAGEGTEDGAGDEAGKLDEVAANATG